MQNFINICEITWVVFEIFGKNEIFPSTLTHPVSLKLNHFAYDVMKLRMKFSSRMCENRL